MPRILTPIEADHVWYFSPLNHSRRARVEFSDRDQVLLEEQARITREETLKNLYGAEMITVTAAVVDVEDSAMPTKVGWA